MRYIRRVQTRIRGTGGLRNSPYNWELDLQANQPSTFCCVCIIRSVYNLLAMQCYISDHADDLLVISISPEGLQQSLDVNHKHALACVAGAWK